MACNPSCVLVPHHGFPQGVHHFTQKIQTQTSNKMGEWGTVNIRHILVIYGTLVEHDLLKVHVVKKGEAILSGNYLT